MGKTVNGELLLFLRQKGGKDEGSTIRRQQKYPPSHFRAKTVNAVYSRFDTILAEDFFFPLFVNHWRKKLMINICSNISVRF